MGFLPRGPGLVDGTSAVRARPAGDRSQVKCDGLLSGCDHRQRRSGDGDGDLVENLLSDLVGRLAEHRLMNEAPRTGLVPEVKPVTGILVKEPAQKERTWWRSLASLERLAEPPAELNVIGAFADRVAATDAVWTAVYGWPVGIV